MGRFDRAQSYFQEHPGILAELGITNAQTQLIQNYINGERSLLTIRDRIMGWTGEDLPLELLARYVEILQEIGWVEMEEGDS